VIHIYPITYIFSKRYPRRRHAPHRDPTRPRDAPARARPRARDSSVDSTALDRARAPTDAAVATMPTTTMRTTTTATTATTRGGRRAREGRARDDGRRRAMPRCGATARDERAMGRARWAGRGPGRARAGTRAAASGDDKKALTLEERIASGEFTKASSTGPFRKVADGLRGLVPEDAGPVGRGVSLALARLSRRWRAEAMSKMPVASGDIREIAGQPVFVPLYKLFLAYGEMFVLAIGPKKFVVVSDNAVAKEMLLTQAKSFSKGLLSEILDFVMGQGLIPANGEVWKIRRKVIVPSLHKKYVTSMVDMFGDCGLKGMSQLARAEKANESVEMENFYSRFALDIIGKAVFNYDFDSLSTDDPVIKAVYTVLREAEYRSVTFIPYWKVPPLRWLVPRQRQCQEALQVVNDTLDDLINRCKAVVEEEDEEFVEEYMNTDDPSILHFLIASGDDVTSKQLRDDLMTLLIAGHETTAAVLTWTTFLLAKHPEVKAKVFEEVDRVVGDRNPTVADMRALVYTTRVINESMRLYPQPPVLIRRALEPVTLGGYNIDAGTDFFISVWNLHRNPRIWDEPDAFKPERFPIDAPMPNEYTEEYAYLPFGGGQRKCVGDQFAIFESIVSLAMLMRRFDFELDESKHPDGECGMTTGATIHTTNGLHVKLKRRDGRGGREMDGTYVTGMALSNLEDVDVVRGSIDAPTASADEFDAAVDDVDGDTSEKLERAKEIIEEETAKAR
jgi:beta-ring hydroxylase